MSHSSKPENGNSLQKRQDAPADMQRLQSQLDELKDMADLLPVLASVQEHLEEEKARHQKRMSTMLILFAVMFGFFLIAPIYLGKALLNQSQENFASQQRLQTELLEAVQLGGGSAEAEANYQAQLDAEKARMASTLELLLAEVDAAIQASSKP